MNYLNCAQLEKLYNRFDDYEFFDLPASFLFRCKADEEDVLTYCAKLSEKMKRKLSFVKTIDGYIDITFHDESYDNKSNKPLDLLDCIHNGLKTAGRLLWSDYLINKKWRYMTVDRKQVLLHTHKPYFDESYDRWTITKLTLEEAFASGVDPHVFELPKDVFNVEELLELLDLFDPRYILFERG